MNNSRLLGSEGTLKAGQLDSVGPVGTELSAQLEVALWDSLAPSGAGHRELGPVDLI